MARAFKANVFRLALQIVGGLIFVHYLAQRFGILPPTKNNMVHIASLSVLWLAHRLRLERKLYGSDGSMTVSKDTPLEYLVQEAGKPVGTGHQADVKVDDMLVGGSGSSPTLKGLLTHTETIRARYVINAAGGASDRVSGLIGDDSFKIKPRVGEYLLLHRDQVGNVFFNLSEPSCPCFLFF